MHDGSPDRLGMRDDDGVIDLTCTQFLDVIDDTLLQLAHALAVRRAHRAAPRVPGAPSRIARERREIAARPFARVMFVKCPRDLNVAWHARGNGLCGFQRPAARAALQ